MKIPTQPWLHSPRLTVGIAFLLVLVAVVTLYAPGLSGGFLFDDFPNIVDNKGVQITNLSLPSLVSATLSSPSSDFKRPLASLSFGLNHVLTGLDPFWMKLTNLCIHLMNGVLVFLFCILLLRALDARKCAQGATHAEQSANADSSLNLWTSLLIAASWLILPINLTSVLYIVQRMESLANLFVMGGLIGYLCVRRGMQKKRTRWTHLACAISLVAPMLLGLLAKETAILLPLYAIILEWMIFGFRSVASTNTARAPLEKTPLQFDRGLITLFVIILAIPFVIGIAWLLPPLLRSDSWSGRPFNLSTRVLSEFRIVVNYVGWTIIPLPDNLSFYHDDFQISQSLFTPKSTFVSAMALLSMLVLILICRRQFPSVSIGLGLYLGCHSLTGTFLPLELIYEHRNYFASVGILIAIVPLMTGQAAGFFGRPLPLPFARTTLLTALIAWWALQTGLTSYAWSSPLALSQELATRAPKSPRALYELGRMYIILSHYNPSSPFTRLAYEPLERAAALPDATILPEQALIFMNSRMGLPLKEAWWLSMTHKLSVRRPGVQDESSLQALTQCAHEQRCDLPVQPMINAFLAALSHPQPSARLQSIYGDFAWNILGDRELGARMLSGAVGTAPREAAYRITLTRMLITEGKRDIASKQIGELQALNIGGQLDTSISDLQQRLKSSP